MLRQEVNLYHIDFRVSTLKFSDLSGVLTYASALKVEEKIRASADLQNKIGLSTKFNSSLSKLDEIRSSLIASGRGRK